MGQSQKKKLKIGAKRQWLSLRNSARRLRDYSLDQISLFGSAMKHLLATKMVTVGLLALMNWGQQLANTLTWLMGVKRMSDWPGLSSLPVSNQTFRVYRNLHRRCYSVQTKRPKVGWRLAFHTTSLTLTGVSFKVYERGREKVIQTGKKSVHAYVLGTLASPHILVYPTNLIRVSYNPFARGEFVRPDGSRVDKALTAHFTPTGVYVE